jgi:hypothetical protein
MNASNISLSTSRRLSLLRAFFPDEAGPAKAILNTRGSAPLCSRRDVVLFSSVLSIQVYAANLPVESVVLKYLVSDSHGSSIMVPLR